jgi:hypothetical protein
MFVTGALYVPTGSVGIGITNPYTSLAIKNGNFGIYQISGSGTSSLGGQIYLGDLNFDSSGYFNSAPGIGAVWSTANAVCGDLAFYVYNSGANTRYERMRITSTGLVVIGGTTPSALESKLNLVSANDQAAISFNNTYSDNRWSIRPGTFAVSNDGLGFYDEKNSRTVLQLTNAGNILIGTTTDNGSSKLQVVNNTFMTMADSPALNVNRTTSDGGLIIFQKNGSNVGYIATNTYSLPSDLNFKKNINTLDLGLNLITKLRPVSYNHKIDDEGAALSTGFIAQELETSLTELGVEKNKYYVLQHTPNEKEGESQYWLDYTKMIPVLTKAIQELNTKFEEYKATHP